MPRDLVASGDMEPDFREWKIDSGDSGYVVLCRDHQQTAVILAVRHEREAGYCARRPVTKFVAFDAERDQGSRCNGFKARDEGERRLKSPGMGCA